MRKILIVFGTRPEAIKMSPLIKAFHRDTGSFETRVCVTAQHREMLDQVLDFFSISPDYDLNLMKPEQNLYDLTGSIITNMKFILKDFQPDFVLVHGDTTTTMAAALSAFYSEAKVCHVEAGLRTNNKYSPFPEEMNRQIVSRLSDYHFAPTMLSRENLLKENIDINSILVTGNTVIDSLFESTDRVSNKPSDLVLELNEILEGKDVLLVTCHRRENHGIGLKNICEALKIIAEDNLNRIIVFPVHLNPKINGPVKRILKASKNIMLIDPLSYMDFIWMMNRAKLIITDSGGIQEEAPSLGKPVLVLRDTTERPEAVEAGTVVLVGTDKQLIITEALDLLNNPKRYKRMSELNNPYGDGKACARIVDFIRNISLNR